MADQDTVGTLANEIGSAFAPAGDAFSSDSIFEGFAESLGWNISSIPQGLSGVAAPAVQIAGMIENGDVTGSETAGLIAAIVAFAGGVNGIASQPDGSFPAGLDVAAFKAEFPQQLIDFLVVEYLFNRLGNWGTLLQLAGVIRLEDVAASATRPAFTRRSIAWQDLGRFFSDPTSVFQNAYHWGQADFRDAELLQNIANVLEGWNIGYGFAALDPAMFTNLTAGALQSDNVFPAALQVPFFEERFSGFGGSVGLEAIILPQTASKFGGLAILPYADGNVFESIALSDDVSLAARGQLQVAGGIAILFRPNDPVTLSTGAPTAAAAFSLTLTIQDPSGGKTLLLGTESASRLEYGSLNLTLGFRVDSKGGSFYAEAALNDGSLVIAPGSDADGFLAQLLPANLTVDASVTLGVDSRQGVYFSGSGGLEIQIPAHITLGPIEIDSATISVKPAPGSLPIELGATIQGNLGPLQAVVDNVGIKIPLTFPGSGGNLGPVDAGLAFKPPNGIGLSVNAGVVSGGGYLYIDTDRGEYAGALQLEVADFLSLAAIGLISTRMPDSSKGFSLLIIVTADFGPGIQLGFGFTLLAVGGLLGLNRSAVLQALTDGVRTGSIQSVMFPRDVIANAPQIISDLRAIFPPQQGTFLIGPMAKLGWGEPTLARLSLGVIIEIPPGDVAILGILQLALPTPDVALLLLQVNFIGALEFDKQRFYFFASLFDSHVLFITLQGEMGVLFAYGDNANFVVTVGGFHPQFNPPPLPFPTPKRIAIDLINESYAKIHADAYFAVTTNTLQFGSHATFFFGFSACSVEGDSGFDALIQFSPFHFVVDINSQFSVKVFGVGVYGIGIDVSLSGPAPWHVHGTASLSFFFFSIDIGIDFTWGDNPNSTLPPVAVMPIVAAEFQKRSNWKTSLSANASLLVALRQLDPAEASLILHPAGTLQISQRAIPLDLKLDKVGSQQPSDANEFSVSLTSASLTKVQDLEESFAPAQFQDFSDAQKLSEPAYVPQHGGIEVAGASSVASDTAITRVLRYDLTVVDAESEPRRFRFFQTGGGFFKQFLRGNSAAQSRMSARYAAKTHPYPGSVQVNSELFTVALRSTNQAFAAESVGFTSQASARDYMANAVASNPGLAGQLHVLPHFEVAP